MNISKAITEKVHPYIYAICGDNALDIESIVQTVFEYYKINPLLAYAANREHKVSHARQVVMYLAHILLGKGYTEIAKLLNRKDHTTILHGVRSIKDQMKVDMAVRNDVVTLHQSLQSRHVIGKRKIA